MSPADHIHQTMCVCFYLCVIIVVNINNIMCSGWKIEAYDYKSTKAEFGTRLVHSRKRGSNFTPKMVQIRMITVTFQCMAREKSVWSQSI